MAPEFMSNLINCYLLLIVFLKLEITQVHTIEPHSWWKMFMFGKLSVMLVEIVVVGAREPSSKLDRNNNTEF